MAGPEPTIAALAFLADRHTAALVDDEGAIVWCCLPRIDSSAAFARLLDTDGGGHCTVAPARSSRPPERRYLDGTLVLETTWTTETGRARVLDLLAIDGGDPRRPLATLLRVCEGVEGEVELDVAVDARFDYGTARPWVRPAGRGAFRLTAGDDGLIAWTDAELARDGEHGLRGRIRVGAGERRRLALCRRPPHELDVPRPPLPDANGVDAALDDTIGAWRRWSGRLQVPELDADGVRTSALVLHGLGNAATGAVAAAATTSLPESAQGRTWDYRYSWVRDSAFAARSMAELGSPDLADDLHRFILRSAAGDAADVQVAYGVGGERRLVEIELDGLSGWRGIGPVRVGNGAADQKQHDILGEVVNLIWRSHQRGAGPGEDDWRFVRAVVDRAATCWHEPDRGIWEWRGGARRFVHSAALCWAALEHGLQLAHATGHEADIARWRRERDAAGAAIDRHGVDGRGAFVQAFDGEELDAAALLLPMAGWCAWDDPRMLATADAVAERLADGALLRRYEADDGQPGREHAFVACSFWLAECLARQGRRDAARDVFERAIGARTDLGLFAEQADGSTLEPWGNFPQALTHLAHVAAALALAGSGT